MNKHDGKMQGTQNPGVPSHLSGVTCTVVSSVFIKHSFLGFRCQTIPQKTLIKKKNLISNVIEMIIVQLSKL